MTEGIEREFLGGKKARLWTYLILGAVAVGAVLVGNLALSNPEVAQRGVKSFLGMPSWTFPTIAFLLGVVIFWLGLKIETDWPEALGAALISASVATFEIIIGIERFEIGGLGVIPYLIPVALFIVLVMFAVVRSK